MEKLLSAKEREKLIQRHRKERNGRIRDRIKAVLAFDDGYSYTEIARILLLDDETIRRHIDDYQRENKLSTANGGSDGKLSDRETREFSDHLQEVTYLYVKDICQYVREHYGKTFSVSGMTKWLHSHDFCYKKPHAVPAKADREQQKAVDEGSCIYFTLL
jgi:transposase